MSHPTWEYPREFSDCTDLAVVVAQELKGSSSLDTLSNLLLPSWRMPHPFHLLLQQLNLDSDSTLSTQHQFTFFHTAAASPRGLPSFTRTVAASLRGLPRFTHTVSASPRGLPCFTHTEFLLLYRPIGTRERKQHTVAFFYQLEW